MNSVDPFPHLRRFSDPSRSLLNTYFEQNVPIELSKDHTTVASSEDQVYNLIRVACDESAHATFEMMSSLLQRASRLPATSSAVASCSLPNRPGQFRSATRMPSSVESPNDSDMCPLSSDCESYTTGAIHTSDNDISLLSDTDVDNESTGHETTRPELITQEPPGASGSTQGGNPGVPSYGGS